MEYYTILEENFDHDEWQQGTQTEATLFEILANIPGMGNSDHFSSKCILFINFISEKCNPFMLLKQFITY